MSDLETFHRLLVMQLAASAPARLRASLTVAEIRETLLPYRRFRGLLGLHMEEDYDALLLQLAAGDDGLAALDDATVLKLFQAERRSPNPDLLQLDVHAAATLTLGGAHVDRVLTARAAKDGAAVPEQVRAEMEEEPETGIVFELPSAAEPPIPIAPRTAAPAADAVVVEAASPDCLFCGGALPSGRTVRFCPHCGQNQQSMRCAECGAEAELGWKHCVTCGSGLPTL